MDQATEMLTLLAAFILTVIATGRLTRLITQDTFPPAAWWRAKWDDWTEHSSWNDLFQCPFCLAPWLAIPLIAWGWATDLHWSWWAFTGWLSVSYLASMLVFRDEGE